MLTCLIEKLILEYHFGIWMNRIDTQQTLIIYCNKIGVEVEGFGSFYNLDWNVNDDETYLRNA